MVAEVVDGEELISDLIPGLKESRKIPLIGTEANTGFVPTLGGTVLLTEHTRNS